MRVFSFLLSTGNNNPRVLISPSNTRMRRVLLAPVTVATVAGVFKTLWLARVSIGGADGAASCMVNGGKSQFAEFGFGDGGQIQVAIMGAD